MIHITGPNFAEIFGDDCPEKGPDGKPSPEFEAYIRGNIVALHRYQATQRARAMDAAPKRGRDELLIDRAARDEDDDIELIRQFLKAYRERSAKDNVIESGLRTAGEVAQVGSEIGEAGASLMSPQNDDDDDDDDDDKSGSVVPAIAGAALLEGLDKRKRGKDRDARARAADARMNEIYRIAREQNLPIANPGKTTTTAAPVPVSSFYSKPATSGRALDSRHVPTDIELIEAQCVLSGPYLPGGRR